MPGDLERLPAAAPAMGPAALAAELLGRVRAELSVVSGLGEREQILVAAWLTGLRSARTRRAYAGDVAAWLGWLAGHGSRNRRDDRHEQDQAKPECARVAVQRVANRLPPPATVTRPP